MAIAIHLRHNCRMLKQLQFKGTWRDYQQRVLDEFDEHLDDKRIHIVAAPGSGKTILGLELLRRLGRPALVLAPSLTVRNQWPERLVPLFLPEAPQPGQLSYDLAHPAQLTAATYQALHSVWSDDEDHRRTALLGWAAEHGPLTLVLDEAHHLRREWWVALGGLIEALADVRIVALTATPPYDAPLAEWHRYIDACGPIDMEIGIPELVRNGDLCPHQDHVVFSRPSEGLMTLLDQRRASISELLTDLRGDRGLSEAILAHPWMATPGELVADILAAPERLSAMLIHLGAAGYDLPPAPLELLGVSANDMPLPSPRWSEILLSQLVFDSSDHAVLDREQRRELRDRLHRLGLIEAKRVVLGETQSLVRMMAGDRAKIGSIGAIVQAESRNMGESLRMVILADHVRAGELPKSAAADFTPVKLGVAPVWESLRRLELPGERLAILTGTLVVLPQEALTALEELGRERGLSTADLRPVPLPHCDSHARIETNTRGRNALVGLVTQLFTQGDVTILVGTQALLGEGWDAPVINSLILASNSASYMLSNQMRGRAIRIDPARPAKVANIWHLATVDWRDRSMLAEWIGRLDLGGIAVGEMATADLDILARRFEAFAGITNDGSEQIEGGLARLHLFAEPSPEAANAATFARAADREAIARDWARSLGNAPPRAHVRETASPAYSPRPLVWRHTLQWLGVGAASAGATAGAWQVFLTTGSGAAFLLAGGSSAACLAALPKLAKAGWLAMRNGSLEGSLRQVGKAVLAGLYEAGAIGVHDWKDAEIRVARRLNGSAIVVFHGISRPAERLAVEALAEVLGPVQNPRYLLVRKGRFGFGRTTDFHAVPTIIGTRKEQAEIFAARWNSHVGPSELVFCRSVEGRIELLRARARSMAAGFQRAVERRSRWR